MQPEQTITQNKLSKKFLALLYNYKISIAVVFFLTLIGALIRTYKSMWGTEIFFFNLDDFQHFALSGFHHQELVMRKVFHTRP